MRVIRGFESLIDGLVRLMTLAIAVLMFVEVMIRMFFPDLILTWQEEVARAMFIYVIVVGAALALRDQGHFTMSMVVRRLSQRDQRRAVLLNILLIWLFSGTWFVTSLPWVQSSAGNLTPALQMDFRLIYGAFPTGALMMTIYAIILLVRQLRTSEPVELGHGEAESQAN